MRLPPIAQAPPAAALHLARTVCRRAERNVISAARSEEVNAFAVPYLNRLSDLLFVLSRWVNNRTGISDTEWIPDTS
jgi:cob(I)alamin adenosyltransferase